MILVRRANGDFFEVVSGQHRLQAQLKVFGKAAAQDIESGEVFDVHSVDGQLVVLQRAGEAAAETIAADAIRRAADRRALLPSSNNQRQNMSRGLLKSLVRSIALRVLRVRASCSRATFEMLARERTIVCSNHVSLLDGVIVALASPVPLTFGVDTDFSRRNGLSRRGMAALAWLGFGDIIPIDASSPFGIRALAKALERGESVMLFPEGRISDTGTPQREQPGVDWLVSRSGARVHRIRIVGAERSRLFAKAGRDLWPPIQIIF